MSQGLLEEQIIFPTKPKRDYWAQYRNARRTVFSAQGKFSNFLDRTRQRKSWCDVEETWNRRNITKNHQQSKKIYSNLLTINRKREDCSRVFFSTFSVHHETNSPLLWTKHTKIISLAGASLYLPRYNEWILCFVTSVLKVLQRLAFICEMPPYWGVVMWHSSKAFYTETTYSPRREWLTMQK